MKYPDPKMEQYWNSLPLKIQSLINETGIEISSLGMLTKLGEYYRGDSSFGSPASSDENSTLS